MEEYRKNVGGVQIGKVHCLFEQSGTFKNEFKALGIDAEDYDILNDFGETDHIIDLFAEIRKGYNNEPSIFDDIKQNELIMAFFPCVRFENQIMLSFRGQAKSMKNWNYKQKMQYCMKLHDELNDMYHLLNMLFIICIDRQIMMILENPYSKEHYLCRYWCYKAQIIDNDRTEKGDYSKKPTQYFFINIVPKNNIVFEPMMLNNVGTTWMDRRIHHYDKDVKSLKVARSLIHPDYANRFIREYII